MTEKYNHLAALSGDTVCRKLFRKASVVLPLVRLLLTNLSRLHRPIPEKSLCKNVVNIMTHRVSVNTCINR